MKPKLTREFVMQRLNYDPNTGVFTLRAHGNIGGPKVGRIAGTVIAAGYRVLSIKRYLYRAQSVAWLYVHGEWPPDLIDHINGDRDDNRISNLRLCSHTQNMRNRRKPHLNSSGLKGVSWCKRQQRWHVQIKADRKTHNIGYFKDKFEAHAAYCRAAEKYHGEFARFD